MTTLAVDAHPLLRTGAFRARWDRPLGETPSPPWLTGLLARDADVPLRADEVVRGAVRRLLRHGGYKPSGRGKPASEYLLAAAGEGTLGSINTAVDLCNAVSLHSGLPISVVDLGRAIAPLRIGIASPDAAYVFNASGQEIRLTGLLCLHDASGPCANAVKDAQRTKTHGGTHEVLCVVWGSSELRDHTDRALAWYRELCQRAGANISDVEIVTG